MSVTGSELYEAVTAEARHRNGQRGAMEPMHYDFGVFGRYSECCEARNSDPLPVTKEKAAAFLLERAAEGANDATLSSEMRFVENFHLLNPNRQFGSVRQMAFRDFHRALMHAKTALVDKVTTLELDAAVRKKAIEMFPNGVVPKGVPDAA